MLRRLRSWGQCQRSAGKSDLTEAGGAERRPSLGQEEVGQRGEEGEKVFVRQGRGRSRGSGQMESWHHPGARSTEHVEGKTPQAFSSLEDADGRSQPDLSLRRHSLLSCLYLTGPCVATGLRSSVSECPECHQTQGMGYWKVPGSLGNPGC